MAGCGYEYGLCPAGYVKLLEQAPAQSHPSAQEVPSLNPTFPWYHKQDSIVFSLVYACPVSCVLYLGMCNMGSLLNLGKPS